jgi:hypothetical protein
MDHQITKSAELKKRLENSMFDIEHALGMYAYNYCTLPAEGIYDKDALAPLMPVIETCHIYLIGFVPKIILVDAHQKAKDIHINFAALNKEHTLIYPIPDGMVFKNDGDHFYLEDSSGNAYWPSAEQLQQRLSLETELIEFNVKYIGQAYGQDGSRHALDRLIKHETLQRISLLGVPENHRLAILMLSVQPNNQLITFINPFAKNKDEDGTRVKSGLDKLYNTTEAERVSLYEASLIRYFYPQYNVEFKDSFPSTNLKILKDCYEKDFGAVVAEICIDELPFKIKSESVAPSQYHVAKHNLHKAEDRKLFFGFQ